MGTLSSLGRGRPSASIARPRRGSRRTSRDEAATTSASLGVDRRGAVRARSKTHARPFSSPSSRSASISSYDVRTPCTVSSGSVCRRCRAMRTTPPRRSSTRSAGAAYLVFRHGIPLDTHGLLHAAHHSSADDAAGRGSTGKLAKLAQAGVAVDAADHGDESVGRRVGARKEARVRGVEGARVTDAAARARWPHVADFADALAASAKPAVVFVTDHAAFHACKLTCIAFGNDPPGIRKEKAPTYYAHRRVAMWFRLADLRALSYETYRTAEWQRAHFGPVRMASSESSARASRSTPSLPRSTRGRRLKRSSSSIRR